MSYKFEEFRDWALVNFPISLDLIEKYENPYPQLSEEDTVKANQ